MIPKRSNCGLVAPRLFKVWFSKITARMNPADLFKLFNQYFEASLTCIHDYHGTVIKLTGEVDLPDK